MEQVDLGFAQLEVGAHGALVRTRNGVDITVELHQSIVGEIEKRIPGDYGVVFDDVHSYSMRFGTLVEIRTNRRLKCIAVVAYRPATYEIAELAASCIEKPLRVFAATTPAQAWIAQQFVQINN